MLNTITVVNKRTHKGDGHYIGRPSVLGNPYSSKNYGLGEKVASVEESIRLYEVWLRDKLESNDTAVIAEMRKLYQHAKREPLYLVCWCKVKGKDKPCHGDVIRNILIEAHEKSKNA